MPERPLEQLHYVIQDSCPVLWLVDTITLMISSPELMDAKSPDLSEMFS